MNLTRLKHRFVNFDKIEAIFFIAAFIVGILHRQYVWPLVLGYFLIKGIYLGFHDPIAKQVRKNKYAAELLDLVDSKVQVTDIPPQGDKSA